MNVIINTANLNRRHFVFFDDTAEICPYALLDIRRNPSFTFFGAEHEVIMKAGISVGHG